MKIKRIEKLEIKEDTGCLTIKDPGENHNFLLSAGIFVKNSADGRGSDITTVGGDSKGFTELDDIYYFARKLYRALKYPLSRVTAAQEKREADVIIGGSRASEISRDEVKWAKHLVKHQNNFCNEFRDLFLLHLEFKGLKSEYELDRDSIKISMNPPSHYKDAMEQGFLEQRFSNYNSMAGNEEFSKYFLYKKYLQLSDEEIKENAEGFKKDKEMRPEEKEDEE